MGARRFGWSGFISAFVLAFSPGHTAAAQVPISGSSATAAGVRVFDSPPSAANPAATHAPQLPTHAADQAGASEMRTILTRATEVRAALIVNPENTLELLDPMEARALRNALGALDPASAFQISYFMRATVTRIAIAGPRYVAGYYNPLLDLWLVTPLIRIGGAWRIDSAKLVDGRSLRGDTALWSANSENALPDLAQSYRASLAGFDQRAADRTTTGSPEAFALLGSRTNAWLAGLATWRQNRAQLNAATTVRDRIGRARLSASRLGQPNVSNQIDGLPAQVRSTMSVIGATRRGDGNRLFLSSALQPELLIVLDFDIRNQPHDIALLNLAGAS